MEDLTFVFRLKKDLFLKYWKKWIYWIGNGFRQNDCTVLNLCEILAPK